jgi:protein TonB
MIAKKNSRYDLERKRIVLFQIGLFVTGSFTLAAFTYRTPIETEKRKQEVAFQQVVILEDELREIPKKSEPIVKELPQSSAPSLPTVAAQPTFSQFINPISSTSIVPTTGVIIGTGDLLLGNETDLIDIPTKDAAFIGGYSAMNAFIWNNLSFPQDAIDMNLQGKVYVSFVVEKDGSVSNVIVERGVGASLDREAARLVRSFPAWIPGEMPKGKVRTRVRLPINFTIE